MSGLNDLADFLKKYVAGIGPSANELSRKIALAIIQDLVSVTPVDTGKALSNWQVTIGDKAASVIPAYSPSPRGKVDPSLTRQANAGPTIEAAVAIIDIKERNEPIFITNNLSYIQFLNDGSSSQSPGGFIERANIIAKQILDNARI